MTRALRIALAAALVLSALAAGAALGFNAEGPNGERVVNLLEDAGITVDPAELDAMADQYGLGSAVRIFVFADAAGVDPSEIADMFDSGMGWGQIARELDLDIGPGIGWIMSGGHGQQHGQGQGQGAGHGHGWGPGGNPNGDDAGEDPAGD